MVRVAGAHAEEVLAVQGPVRAPQADLGQASFLVAKASDQAVRVVNLVSDRNGRGKKVSVRIVRVGKMGVVRIVRVGKMGIVRNGRGKVIVRRVRVVQKVSVRIGRAGKRVIVRNGRGNLGSGRDVRGKKVIRFVVAVNPANVDPTVALVVVPVLSVPESVARVARVSVRIGRAGNLVSARNERGERVIGRLVHGGTVSDRDVRGETVSDRNGRGETVSGRDVRGETVSGRDVRGESSIANDGPSASSPMPNVVPMKCAVPKVAASSSAVKFPTSGRRKSAGSTKVRYVHLESRAPKRASLNDRVLGRFKRPSTLAR